MKEQVKALRSIILCISLSEQLEEPQEIPALSI